MTLVTRPDDFHDGGPYWDEAIMAAWSSGSEEVRLDTRKVYDILGTVFVGASYVDSGRVLRGISTQSTTLRYHGTAFALAACPGLLDYLVRCKLMGFTVECVSGGSGVDFSGFTKCEFDIHVIAPGAPGMYGAGHNGSSPYHNRGVLEFNGAGCHGLVMAPGTFGGGSQGPNGNRFTIIRSGGVKCAADIRCGNDNWLDGVSGESVTDALVKAGEVDATQEHVTNVGALTSGFAGEGATWTAGEHAGKFAWVRSGKGVGQLNLVGGNDVDSGSTLYPWDVALDGSSELAIGWECTGQIVADTAGNQQLDVWPGIAPVTGMKTAGYGFEFTAADGTIVRRRLSGHVGSKLISQAPWDGYHTPQAGDAWRLRRNLVNGLRIGGLRIEGKAGADAVRSTASAWGVSVDHTLDIASLGSGKLFRGNMDGGNKLVSGRILTLQFHGDLDDIDEDGRLWLAPVPSLDGNGNLYQALAMPARGHVLSFITQLSRGRTNGNCEVRAVVNPTAGSDFEIVNKHGDVCRRAAANYPLDAEISFHQWGAVAVYAQVDADFLPRTGNKISGVMEIALP